jgi:peptide/nickel transport system permease protein
MAITGNEQVQQAKPPDAAAYHPPRARSLWDDAARTFLRNKAGMCGLVIVLCLFIVAIFAPVLAPYNYLQQNYTVIMQPPSAHHLMGTDALGRDLLSRVLMSLRTAVLVATLITIIAGVFGVLLGALAGLLGGWINLVITWIMDALLTVPPLWFAAFISVATRPGLANLTAWLYQTTHWAAWQDSIVLDYLVVVSCLGVVSWPGIGRIVRGQVLSLREKEFIEAERALGASNWWIIRKHLLPNVLGPVIVALSVNFGYAMLFEASLSFLGIGIRPPGASLGQMISDGVEYYRSAPYLVAMPGLVLAVIVLAFNFVGDALNDALNPKARR